MLQSVQSLILMAKQGGKRRIAVVCAHDEEVLLSLEKAVKEGIVYPILIGKESLIRTLMSKSKLNFEAEIHNSEDDKESAELAVKMVSSGEAQVLMKGLISTSIFLKAVLNKEWGLRTGNLISHLAIIDSEKLNRLIFMSDGGFTIAPDLMQKKQIIENSVSVLHRLGYERPLVAPVCAVEVVNPDMPATVDASLLSKMADRGQIKGCAVDGPLGLDNAVSMEAAKHKGISGEVAGKADVLIAPNIETGNAIYKALAFMGDAKFAGMLAGSAAPIVLTSRADTNETKFNSIAFACATADKVN